jgi:hypothetical protein
MQVISRNKLRCIVLAVVCVLLIALIATVAGSRTPSDARHSVVPREPNAARRTFALLYGIPQHGSVLGEPNAPVTLQFFGDLQCRDSREVMLGALPYLIRHWVRAGALEIRFRSLETDTKGAGGFLEFSEQQGGALAAGRQGKLWNFIDAFYREQGPEFTGYVDEAFLDRIAAKSGVEMKPWEQDREPADWLNRLGADQAYALSNGVRETPAFLIGPTDGKVRRVRHFGMGDPGVFNEKIEELIHRKDGRPAPSLAGI